VSDPNLPSTWTRFRPSLCQDCWAGCCTLPVEVTVPDLIRLELMTPDEAEGSLKRVARRLEQSGHVVSYRVRTGLFILQQRQGGECVFLGEDRRCTVYEKRPEVCRQFPRIGPRPDFCPARRQNLNERGGRANNSKGRSVD
jgi:Fe-S-cluster containining protein